MTSGSSSDPALAARLKARIRDVPGFPEPGVLFRDITPLLGDPGAFAEATAAMTSPFEAARVDAVAAIESRGFLFGRRRGRVVERGPRSAAQAGETPRRHLLRGLRTRVRHGLPRGPHRRARPRAGGSSSWTTSSPPGAPRQAAFRLCRRLGRGGRGVLVSCSRCRRSGGWRGWKALGPPVRTVLEYP